MATAALLDKFAKRAVVGVLRDVPVSVWQLIAPKDVIAFTYHIVAEEMLPHQRLYAYKTPRQFESDVVYARPNAVTYQELADHRRGIVRMPPNRILFTFDDGLAECFHVIRPILQRHSVGAVFFVNTKFLDDREIFFETTLSLCLGAIEKLGNQQAQDLLAQLELNRVDTSRPASNVDLARNRLRGARVTLPTRAHKKVALWLLGFEEDGSEEIDRTWRLLGHGTPPRPSTTPTCLTTDQVKQLARDGFVIGSHGSTHIPMQKLSSRAMEDHIVTSCETVRSLTGQQRVPFAFPYTGRGIDRVILADILRRNPLIDLLFDTQDFCRDVDFVVQRICADVPPGRGVTSTNLPLLLRSAWSRRSSWYRAAP